MPLIFSGMNQVEGLVAYNNIDSGSLIKSSKIIVPIKENINSEIENVIYEDNTSTQNINVEDSFHIDDEVEGTVDELINEYLESIEEQDLERGKELLEKLDLDYLLSFDRTNLSEDDKQEIKEYLQNNLTPGEYDEVISLIGKYIGLVQ
jgi:hypothetical protein